MSLISVPLTSGSAATESNGVTSPPPNKGKGKLVQEDPMDDDEDDEEDEEEDEEEGDDDEMEVSYFPNSAYSFDASNMSQSIFCFLLQEDNLEEIDHRTRVDRNERPRL